MCTPRQRPGEYAGVMVKFIERLWRKKPLILYGDGKQTRGFTYIEDVVDAHIDLNSEDGAG